MIEMYTDEYKMEKIPSEFEKRVNQYMECDKRTLAELLAMRDLGIYPYDDNKNGCTPAREIMNEELYPNIRRNITLPNPYAPSPWWPDNVVYAYTRNQDTDDFYSTASSSFTN